MGDPARRQCGLRRRHGGCAGNPRVAARGPRDPDRPLVCVDETSKQLIAETRAPIPAKPGQPARLSPVDPTNTVSDPPPSLHGHYPASSLLWGGPRLTGPSVLSSTSSMAATKPALASGGITHCRLRCGLSAFFFRVRPIVGSGQPEHPYAGLALCRLPRPRSATRADSDHSVIVAGLVDDAQFDDFFFEQTQAPTGEPLRGRRASQSDQFRLRRSVENPRPG